MAEIELQLLQLDQDLRTETQKELGEIRAKVAELTERRTAAEDQVRRVEIRAPRRVTSTNWRRIPWAA